MMNVLSIDTILPELRSQLRNRNNIVLTADPGAGKTTRVPLALLNEPWMNDRKIIMLEPRRIAAIRSAEYTAALLNEKPGGTVGYRIRGDNRIGKKTRIEIVTEGVLTRMLHEDPSLPDVALLIFDEFHERSIHADLGLALALDVQEQLRPDIHLLVMSATLDVVLLSVLLGDAPIVKCEGKMFPVETIYRSEPKNNQFESAVAAAIRTALREQEGDILVFLPGQREIRRTESLLREMELSPQPHIALLYGEASPDHQRTALQPPPAGKRKVILSTSIAETSLTIDGVRIVIDSGLARRASFDPKRGMSGLVTTSVSKAAADQRRGRAGRQQPGICYRLWTRNEQSLLPEFAPPEILTADLASFALDIALWGDPEARHLKFLDPPPQKHLSQARSLLRYIGVLNADGKITDHGRSLAGFGIHPRLSHMLIRAKERGLGRIACDVAALLEERDFLRGRSESDIDLFSRYHALKEDKGDNNAIQRIREHSARLQRLMGVHRQPVSDQRGSAALGPMVALAYPERVAKRKEQGEKYQLMGNTVGTLPKNSHLAKEDYLAVAEVDGAGADVKIFLAASITRNEIWEMFSDQIQTGNEVYWDDRQECIIARAVTKFGSIELSSKAIEPEKELVQTIMCGVIREKGIDILPWEKESGSLRMRSEWLRRNGLTKSEWIDLSDGNLLRTLEEWLAPYLSGIKKRTQLNGLDMNAIVRSMFSYDQWKELNRLAPPHVTVPTGSQIPLDYSGEKPVLAVRLQEMFGETNTPAVGGGSVKVLLHLLSPARRPLAVTQDLPSFWKNAYSDVKKDMRGQYPKHYWPDDPLEAEPTKRTKKFMK